MLATACAWRSAAAYFAAATATDVAARSSSTASAIAASPPAGVLATQAGKEEEEDEKGINRRGGVEGGGKHKRAPSPAKHLTCHNSIIAAVIIITIAAPREALELALCDHAVNRGAHRHRRRRHEALDERRRAPRRLGAELAAAVVLGRRDAHGELDAAVGAGVVAAREHLQALGEEAVDEQQQAVGLPRAGHADRRDRGVGVVVDDDLGFFEGEKKKGGGRGGRATQCMSVSEQDRRHSKGEDR